MYGASARYGVTIYCFLSKSGNEADFLGVKWLLDSRLQAYYISTKSWDVEYMNCVLNYQT